LVVIDGPEWPTPSLSMPPPLHPRTRLPRSHKRVMRNSVIAVTALALIFWDPRLEG
jgi:hypothetical protein